MHDSGSPLRSSVFLAAMMLTLAASIASAGPYSFTKLAESGALDAFGVPAVNESGAAAFAGGQGIYRADGANVTTIAETSEGGFYSFTGCGTFQLVNFPDLDAIGRVVFRAYTFDPGTWECREAIYLGDGITATAVTDTGSGGAVYSDWTHPGASDSGVLAFRGRDGGPGVIGIYRSIAGAAPELVIDDTGDLQSFGDPDVNDSGEAVFHAMDSSGREGIYVTSGGAPTIVARTDFGYWSIQNEPAIASGPVVAFLAETSDWTHAVFVWDGATAQIASGDGPFDQFAAAAVNASGQVAFWARLDDWSHGIFTGPDPVADRVIATGDSLFGSVVTTLESGRHALNDGGQVAFAYQLESGESGIALATPEATTGVPGGAGAASEVSFFLAPAFPNPTRAGAALRFRLPEGEERHELAIYDVPGRLVRKIATGTSGGGGYVATWDGKDEAGRDVPAGLYFFRLVAADRARSARVLVIR